MIYLGKYIILYDFLMIFRFLHCQLLKNLLSMIIRNAFLPRFLKKCIIYYAFHGNMVIRNVMHYTLRFSQEKLLSMFIRNVFLTRFTKNELYAMLFMETFLSTILFFKNFYNPPRFSRERQLATLQFIINILSTRLLCFPN